MTTTGNGMTTMRRGEGMAPCQTTSTPHHRCEQLLAGRIWGASEWTTTRGREGSRDETTWRRGDKGTTTITTTTTTTTTTVPTTAASAAPRTTATSNCSWGECGVRVLE